ncbi:unnamed protein product [Heterobilharzia americana]|nr:unnamed protein product [Heterobilharzia americana]
MVSCFARLSGFGFFHIEKLPLAILNLKRSNVCSTSVRRRTSPLRIRQLTSQQLKIGIIIPLNQTGLPPVTGSWAFQLPNCLSSRFSSEVIPQEISFLVIHTHLELTVKLVGQEQRIK